MGGTKIIVFQLKELIKTIIFAVIGLILIIALIYFFVPKGKAQTNEGNETMKVQYNPGEYTQKLTIHSNAPLEIAVTVSEDKITDIKLVGLDEATELFYPLLKPAAETLSKEIINKQTTDIKIPEDFKITGEFLISAIRNALQESIIVEN